MLGGDKRFLESAEEQLHAHPAMGYHIRVPKVDRAKKHSASSNTLRQMIANWEEGSSLLRLYSSLADPAGYLKSYF